MGMGRFGQVLAPLFASAATAAGWSGGQVFLAIAIAPLVGSLAIVAIKVYSRGLNVEHGI